MSHISCKMKAPPSLKLGFWEKEIMEVPPRDTCIYFVSPIHAYTVAL